MEPSVSIGGRLVGCGWAPDTVETQVGFYISNYTVIFCYSPSPSPFFLRGAEAKERGVLGADFPEPKKSVVHNAKGCADWSEGTLESSEQEKHSQVSL